MQTRTKYLEKLEDLSALLGQLGEKSVLDVRAVGRALATKPEVLLMDEPTSALDPLSTALIEELMVLLARERTVVVVTHNMQQATRVADKTAFFYLGELIEGGPTKQLFGNPRQQKTRDYLTGRFS